MRKRCLETVYHLAKENKNIVFVGSDLTSDANFRRFGEEMPNQFFMEGIYEGHLAGMSSGMATSGKIVYFNTIATFITRRCFEQNSIDLGLTNANVRLIANGGGLVYAPLGPTHLAIDDIGIMRMIPNMTIVAPSDADEMERAVRASVHHVGPMYFRLGKGGDPIISRPELGFEIGKAIVYREPGDVLLISTGIMTSSVLQAADRLKEMGIAAGVVHLHTLKPLDSECLLERISKARAVVTIEEHLIHGGLGSAVAELLAEQNFKRPIAFKRIGLPDLFPDEYGSQASLLQKYGVCLDNIVSIAKSLLG